MPCDCQNEVKAKFPLPEYPQEDQFDNPMQYKRAVEQFGVDHACVFTEHEQWVDCEVVTDITHTSKAT